MNIKCSWEVLSKWSPFPQTLSPGLRKPCQVSVSEAQIHTCGSLGKHVSMFSVVIDHVSMFLRIHMCVCV